MLETSHCVATYYFCACSIGTNSLNIATMTTVHYNEGAWKVTTSIGFVNISKVPYLQNVSLGMGNINTFM